MKIDIIGRNSGEALFSHTCKGNTIKSTLEAATREGADLWGANLWGADLGGADFFGANTKGAAYGSATLDNGIVQLLGLLWEVYVFDNHIKIGCKMHTTQEWDGFSDEEISEMDKNALEFWKANKAAIMVLARAHQGK